ncbi:ABC transporter substrate-binding protein [Chitinibacter bivalviorum]|uniref:ABC transporter substrate-binding protein n=1 Tax=Chitinibacter bivalviorum TaxID=2739434 RepID=A0A7H9BFB8_9NEIS|nr:extracellular solute-binding protein [Chitinibacter bivalviorum]QLG87112.1 ABC transporter substrate-binding protein [Chitinibacter bivalviorum]
MKKIIFLLCCLCHAQVWAAHAYSLGDTAKYPANFTSFAYADPMAKPGGELILPNPDRRTSFDSFNPFIIKGTPAAGLGALMFESLGTMSLDETATMYGLLASDIAVAPDGKSVTFTLNAKARFNNGDVVTAQDVKHSFDTLNSKLAAPQYTSQLADVAGVDVLDAKTIRYRFKTANREMPQIVGSLPVFSHKWGGGQPLDKIALEKPITSGPYRIADYKLGRSISYQRRADYWGKDLPTRLGQYNFDRVTYRYYQDEVAKLEAFKAGEFDFITEYSARNWARQYQGPKFRRGDILKRELRHHNSSGMQGYVLNLRKPQFADIRVRQALGLALDFEWLNRQLFYSQYTRLNSFYANGELAASGKPSEAELALLKPLAKDLPPAVFGELPAPPNTDRLPNGAPGSLRDNLRQARELLKQAGWTYRDGALRNAKGDAFTFEILDDGGAMARVFPPLARNLAKLGITAKLRNIDFALYQRRLDNFDFDVTVLRFPDVQSPGQELLDYYGSKAADVKGSSNVIGIKNPAIDALINHVLAAPNRTAQITAVHALDRALLAGYYIIPHWYSATHRVAWRDRFAMPKVMPLYYQAGDWMLATWWVK